MTGFDEFVQKNRSVGANLVDVVRRKACDQGRLLEGMAFRDCVATGDGISWWGKTRSIGLTSRGAATFVLAAGVSPRSKWEK